MPFENQARVHFDEESLISMAETIKIHGIRQPLTVIKTKIKKAFLRSSAVKEGLEQLLLLTLSQFPV